MYSTWRNWTVTNEFTSWQVLAVNKLSSSSSCHQSPMTRSTWHHLFFTSPCAQTIGKDKQGHSESSGFPWPPQRRPFLLYWWRGGVFQGRLDNLPKLIRESSVHSSPFRCRCEAADTVCRDRGLELTATFLFLSLFLFSFFMVGPCSVIASLHSSFR